VSRLWQDRLWTDENLGIEEARLETNCVGTLSLSGGLYAASLATFMVRAYRGLAGSMMMIVIIVMITVDEIAWGRECAAGGLVTVPERGIERP
jgi:hypothetical protein